jgi:hypothetical protein
VIVRRTKTADDVTTLLQQKIAAVKPIKVSTAADDPNHLLGRPHGYTSKTAFADSRVPADEVEYLAGPVLVRVSRLLTPDQAKEYEAAVKA